jgi:hypothetical protein
MALGVVNLPRVAVIGFGAEYRVSVMHRREEFEVVRATHRRDAEVIGVYFLELSDVDSDGARGVR